MLLLSLCSACSEYINLETGVHGRARVLNENTGESRTRQARLTAPGVEGLLYVD